MLSYSNVLLFLSGAVKLNFATTNYISSSCYNFTQKSTVCADESLICVYYTFTLFGSCKPLKRASLILFLDLTCECALTHTHTHTHTHTNTHKHTMQVTRIGFSIVSKVHCATYETKQRSRR